MRTWGVHAHKFPEYPKLGIISDAKEVGDRGEVKRLSCPTTMESCAQSSLALAMRRRTRPELIPSRAAKGNPPPKSTWTSPLVLAPANCGPKTSRPSSDCRRVAPKAPFAPYALDGAAYVGISRLSTE